MRGYVIPIGGAEEKTRDPEILQRFVTLCGGPASRIAVIPTASRLEETGPRYKEIFEGLGSDNVSVLPFETREECRDPKLLATLEQANGVFLTGGNQLRLSTTLGGTPVAEILRQRNANDGLHYAGTSAGAAIVSEHMIAGGEEGSTPSSNKVTLAPGMGLLDWAIVDQHFRQRDRLGRLMSALAYNPRPIGIGLDEDTAAFIDPYGKLEVDGSGAITILDTADIEFTSMDSAHQGDPVTIIGMRLHILTRGATFDWPTRTAKPALQESTR